MSDFNNGYSRPIPSTGDMAVDAGLRRFMLGVYNKMALGLVVSGALAFATSSIEPVRDLLFRITGEGRLAGYTGLGAIVAFAPLIILLSASFLMKNVTPRTSGIVYWAIVALIGASLGTVGLLYTGASVASIFFITAAAFGGLSLVGYTTKKDLTGMGAFFVMGAWGLLVALLVNAFILKSGAMLMILSGVGVLIFAGLIAYDTQRLKMTYYAVGGDEASLAVATNYGALNLYLDFVNLFRFLLVLFGQRR
ncbi:Bax inhibitor-1/YccA family protein [Caulobacter sp. 17J80-11]|uniref:Bax inhibitor-1/YccA family protein n=1 Tax=Caulobacter sp. 17J80-11 TaxID=2763502 RepID=UPI0016539C7F|nr:Bax inhibitor-1/YccA family protein [Caulobacter sp. 17J80-11]MBC6981528.1 Bax inhibitor-1/YccA family protein [Caulobacter sp. 17J80-11]